MVGEAPRWGPRRAASAAVFTAFVAVATMAFTLQIPATPSGYFNLGEVMVYICALLMGPYVGAFAGGVGSSISDLALGATSYAPGTLIIKGAEGFVVGYLSSRGRERITKEAWRYVTLVIGASVGTMIAGLGYLFFSGSYDLFLGFPIGPGATLSFQIPPALWIALGVAAFAATAAAGYFVDESAGWTVLSVLAGGAVMFTGYFLYNLLVISVGYGPSVEELPFDVGQALIGLMVAVPVAARVRRMWGGRGIAGSPVSK